MTNPDASQVRLTERDALADLRAVLELCAAGKVKCSATTGRPSAATVRAIGAHLNHGDFYPDEAIAAFAWPLLIRAGQLGKQDGTRLQLTPKGRAALRKPPADIIRTLWQRWLTHAMFDEFSRIDQIKGQRSRNVLSAAKPRRQMVATALATCQPGEWIDVDSLFSTMRGGNMSPTIARNDRALWKLYLEDPHYGSLGYVGFHDWELLEGRYTLAVLFEYAGTLGLIDLDYVHPDGARDDYYGNWGADDLPALSRYDGLQAIRLTALGSYALGLSDAYQPVRTEPDGAEPDEAQPLKVLPNLDIVATGTVSAADQLMLSSYAEQTADRVWAVSTTSLLAAIDTGRDLDELTGFLAQRTPHGLPDTLDTLIADVRRRAGALTDRGHIRLIECADSATATLIAEDRTLRPLCQRIGERHLAILPDNDLKFRKALRKLGYVAPRHSAG